MKIELYLNSEKGVVKGDGVANLPPLRRFPIKEDSWHVKKAFVGFSEKEIELRNQLARIANQFNVEFRVYDTAKTLPAFRAWYKGVRGTPTAIIGRNKLTGNITEEEIIKALKAQT